MNFARQAMFPITYNGTPISEHRIDLIVENAVVVELKSVERWDPLFMAQVLTYLRCTGLRIGLLINFNGRTENWSETVHRVTPCVLCVSLCLCGSYVISQSKIGASA